MDKLLKQSLEVLNFKGMLNALDGLSESTQWTPSQWVEPLKILLEAEMAYRTSRSFLYRMERAKLPQIKTLKDFDLCDSPLCSDQIKQLGTCDFIPAHQNILLLGGSGSGKTHLALSFAYAAIQKGYRTRFYQFSELASQMLRAQQHGDALNLIAQLQRFEVLVIDELGYLPIDPKAGALLFDLFSGCYETLSVIITTHLMFNEWGAIFGNKQSTKAMIDRLTHHCTILETGNQSWRLKEGSMIRK